MPTITVLPRLRMKHVFIVYFLAACLHIYLSHTFSDKLHEPRIDTYIAIALGVYVLFLLAKKKQIRT